MSTLGWLHVSFALVAFVAGALIVRIRKGTRRHRRLGYLFFASMLVVNGAGLFIYKDFDGWGPFHWMAVISLATLATGMGAVLTRRPRLQWLGIHGGFMLGAYLGLVTAGGAQLTGNLNGVPEPLGVLLPILLLSSCGIVLISWYLQRVLTSL